MLVRPDERVPIARLLQFLEHGELLARDCAAWQAELAPDPGMKRFLLSQSRQEAAHALVFHGAIAWLSPKHLGTGPLLPALEDYRLKLEAAVVRRDWAETVLAEQIILEGLGEAILTRIEAGLAKRDAPFGRLRRILIHQEEAHYAFGCRALERAIAAGDTEPEALRFPGLEYVALIEAMVATLHDLFEFLDEDPVAWTGDAKSYLPAWLTADRCLLKVAP
nr:ferritin-like domain-containing protein [Nitrospirota bacterium]